MSPAEKGERVAMNMHRIFFRVLPRAGCIGCLFLIFGIGIGIGVLWEPLIWPWFVYPTTLSYAVSLVPVYPGEMMKYPGEYTGVYADPISGIAGRTCRFRNADAATIARFYHDELSKEPWKLYDERSYPGYSGTTTVYCFTFQRQILQGLWIQSYRLTIVPGEDISTRQTTGDVAVYISTISWWFPEDVPCKDPTQVTR